MRLEKPDSNGAFQLAMSPAEWKEVYALAKFAQAGLEYDSLAGYILQVFTYLFLVSSFGLSRPEDMRSNPNMQAAVAGLDRLAERIATDGISGGAVLKLNKEEMRQFVMLLGKAAEAEDKARDLNELIPEKFPYAFPDLIFPGSHYEGVLCDLLKAVHEDRTLDVQW